MPIQVNDGLSVLAAMATPVVLLLANAMLILSTNQRLQSIFNRVRETELTIAGADLAPEIRDLEILNDLLITHSRRARAAHRALLCFYGSAGLFTTVVVSVGLASLDVAGSLPLALFTAFFGCALLFCGTLLLIGETWIGIAATDRRFAAVAEICQRLSTRLQDKAVQSHQKPGS
jgi:hypothetical protein